MTDRALVDMAGKVLDGEPVDWSDPASAAAGRQAVVRNLRIVESIRATLSQQELDQQAEDLVRYLADTWSLEQQRRGEEPGAIDNDELLRWGNLEIRGRIGAGASADVYRAWDAALEREVALKVFRSADPGLQRRMLDEGRRLARVDHPNVVRVFGAERRAGRVGLWMELVEGQTLEDWRSGHVPGEAEVAALGRSLCGALAAVHAAGLVHGDVKAQNVMRRTDGRLVLTDFGSGAERSASDAPATGTPLYLAPEVLAGGPGTPQSDIYGLAVLLFYLLTGSYPVLADSVSALKSAHADQRRQALLDLRPGLDTGLAAALEQALAPRPENRFATAGGFDRALAGLPPNERKRWPAWTWAAAAATVVVAAAWLWMPGPSVRSPAPAYPLDTHLFRLDDQGVSTPLANGDAVTVGDRIVLELTSDRDLHVYVFNEDARGRAYGLFPLPALGKVNPLLGGDSHRLPGLEDNLAWVVDSQGGTERLHVVTSPAPLPELDQRFARLPPARLGPTGFSARGMGSLQRVDGTQPATAAALLQAVDKARGNADAVRGVHHLVLELPHASN